MSRAIDLSSVNHFNVLLAAYLDPKSGEVEHNALADLLIEHGRDDLAAAALQVASLEAREFLEWRQDEDDSRYWGDISYWERAANGDLSAEDLQDLADNFEDGENDPGFLPALAAVSLYCLCRIGRYHLRRQNGQSVYTVWMRDDAGADDTDDLTAESDRDTVRQARRMCREWVAGGDWGEYGAVVEVWLTIHDEFGAVVEEDSLTVEIEPDHDALIRAAGGDTECDHDWVSTVEVEGGCDDNPGVWSCGGTAMSFASHCRHCGLKRTEYCPGSQRNPGEHDTVEYTQPESWCSECECEECQCDDD